MLYDATDKYSIELYAKKLIGKSLKLLLDESSDEYRKGKGGFGQKVEKLFFKYEPNSKSEPDFPEAGVELKTCPLKLTKKGLGSKERMVLNTINYMQEYLNTFEESSFWKKNRLLLLMFFLHDATTKDFEWVFKYVFLWTYPERDLPIIRSDWEKIVDKIRVGKAHELSEGDTLYLAACTKGQKGGENSTLRAQPNNNLKAPQRAFSLKSSYVNTIIAKERYKDEYQSIIDSNSEKNNIEDVDFEDFVIEKFKPFYGASTQEISQILEIKFSNAKDFSASVSRAILGIKNKKKIEEFEKANVQMKTIALKENGVPAEDMSFSQINYIEILNETWENSYWLGAITNRFFFVVFDEKDGKTYLKKVMFWTMPVKDVKTAKKFWKDTKQKIASNDFDNLLKLSDGLPCFTRTKGRDSSDKRLTADGKMEKKRAYWLSRHYIKKIIS